MPVVGVVHQGGLQWGVGGVRGYWGLHMKFKDGLLQSTLENSRCLLQTIEHELNATGGKLVPFLANRLHYQRRWYIWTDVSCLYISTIIFSGQFYVHYYHSLLSSVVYMFVPFFTTRYFYLEGTSELGMSVCKCQGDLTSDCKCQGDLT